MSTLSPGSGDLNLNTVTGQLELPTECEVLWCSEPGNGTVFDSVANRARVICHRCHRHVVKMRPAGSNPNQEPDYHDHFPGWKPC